MDEIHKWKGENIMMDVTHLSLEDIAAEWLYDMEPKDLDGVPTIVLIDDREYSDEEVHIEYHFVKKTEGFEVSSYTNGELNNIVVFTTREQFEAFHLADCV